MGRLTILLDPARIKPSLAAHRQVGHRCATAAVPVRGRQPDPRCPGSHSGPRPSDGTRSATRSVVASAPMT